MPDVRKMSNDIPGMNSRPLIKYINKYVDLTAEEEELLLSRIVSRKYLKGQYVVQQGDV